MPSLVGRVTRLVRTDGASLRQGFVALAFTSLGNLLAGVTLGSITGTLEALPGLIVLVPAAIDMRGNIFGALGSRLGTAIHTGTFRISRRWDSVVGQNVASSIVLTLALSVALAVLAQAATVVFGIPGAISLADFVVVSVVGGAISSVVVLGITVATAVVSARRGWDLDTVAAPAVTAVGDVVTLPSLFLATYLVGIDVVTPVLAVALAGLGVAAFVVGMRRREPVLRRVVRESMPMLVLAGTLSVVTGVTLEGRIEAFLAFPGLLVLLPPFLADAGALGGILSARLASKLHLGLLDPRRPRLGVLASDVTLVVAFAIPLFAFVGVTAAIAAGIVGLATPGVGDMIGVALLAGTLATAAAIVVAYGSAVLTFRAGLDPDNHGIPIVTSTLDLLGAFALVLALVAFGLT